MNVYHISKHEMNASFALLNLSICLLLSALSYAQGGNGINNLKRGPYKATVKGSGKCQEPPKPYEKNPAYLYYSDMYKSGNQTLISGNLTVLRINRYIKIQVKGFMLEGGKWNIMYVANSIGCNGVIIRFWKIALNATQYPECLPKGSYIFKDLDFDSTLQMWVKTLVYGTLRWRFLVSSNAGVTVCWEYEIGAYKVTVLNASRCEQPSRPYQKDRSVVFFAEVYNTTKKASLMRGNITILKENADYRIKLKCYVHEDNGKWAINLVTNSGGCRGVLLSLIATYLGLKYDKERCLLQKGTFSFANVDANQIEHAWYSTQIYGLMKCRIEVFSGSRTAECWEFYEEKTPR